MLSLVAAMDKNRVIGKNGKIPWRLPADLKRFKKLTSGHPVIMGRKTYESLPIRQIKETGRAGRALPDRMNIVLSRTPGFTPPDAVTVPSLKEALDLTRGVDEVFIIGGQSLYEQALPLAEKIYLTVVDIETEDDPAPTEKDAGHVAVFPKFDESEWRIASRESHKKDDENPLDYFYLIYERKKTAQNSSGSGAIAS